MNKGKEKEGEEALKTGHECSEHKVQSGEICCLKHLQHATFLQSEY